jgi:K+-dependent Na+/Ca+ exchanger-like protein
MLVIFSIILLVSFYLLARVVDHYFIEALDKIAADLRMSSDAAGATLMAIGSSAPELLIALFAVFRPGDHAAIGIGNIVGSAIFNVLAIIGAAAIVKKTLIAWQAVVRDLVFYSIAILLLIFLFSNQKVELTHALILIGIYLIYLAVVVNWRKIFKYVDPNEVKQEIKQVDEKSQVWRKVTYPIDFMLEKFFPSQKNYYLVFFTSILIIAGLSWVLVEVAIHIAYILNISEAVIAITVLAAGTSIPDLLSSIQVSRQGRGGMAISNAIGSNIFDILLGLGLPFLLIILINGNPIYLDPRNLNMSAWFLLSSVIVIFVLLVINRWIIGKKMGVFLLLLYVVWAVMNVS